MVCGHLLSWKIDLKFKYLNVGLRCICHIKGEIGGLMDNFDEHVLDYGWIQDWMYWIVGVGRIGLCMASKF